MYKIVLIDDEKMIQKSLKGIIDNFVEDVAVVATPMNVAQGVEAIKKYAPDIVFLDIEMPDGTGFDLLKQLSQIDFSLIFCTASNLHAIKAFKYNAIDYILKPFDIEDVVTAVQKAKDLLKVKQQQINVNQLLSFMQDSNKPKEKIVLKTMSDMFVVRIDEIFNCQSDGGYTIFMFKDNRKIMVSNNLKSYESILLQHNFLRVHRSHMININHIDRIQKKDGGTIVLTNGKEIPISSRRKDAVFEVIGKFL
ncbi:MAG TPA: response regulator transcription factor [Lutibacter sp.]|nr:response regulator transcription factor [Lutibacter sp.]